MGPGGAPSRLIVLDASAAIDLLLDSGGRGEHLNKRVAPLERFHVPELFDVEVMSALRGIERGGLMDEARAATALERLSGLRAERWRHEELRPDMWRRRHRLSIYDAAYVALAKLLDLPLVTADAKLAIVAREDVAVELFEPPAAG